VSQSRWHPAVAGVAMDMKNARVTVYSEATVVNTFTLTIRIADVMAMFQQPKITIVSQDPSFSHSYSALSNILARIIRECEEMGRQKKPPLLQTC
jgi:hypothetical protein